MNILFSGGGTLGSVTPLLAVAEVIKSESQSVKFYWLGTKFGPEKKLIKQVGMVFIAIPAGKWRRYFSLANIIDCFKILLAFSQSVYWLSKLKPAVVVMAGGFVAVPVGWAAWLLNIPLIIHQQDVRPSLSNKLLDLFATVITVNFKESVKYFSSGKVVVIGNPVRQSILQPVDKKSIYQKYNLNPRLPIILAVGGGSGAGFINHLVQICLPRLVPAVQVINIVGKNGEVKQSKNYLAFELFEDVGSLLNISNLVISRAGLGFITELAALAKPSIIIPIPKSHQEDNARYLAAHQAAVVVNQRDLTPDYFLKIVSQLVFDQSRLNTLSYNIHSLYDKNSSNKLVSLIIEQAKKYDVGRG